MLNNTLEEELRIRLIELQKQNTYLQNQISILERCVKEEQDGKYEAYKRIHALNDELKKV